MIPNFIKVDIMRLNSRKKRNQYLMFDLQKNKDIMIFDKLI